jgi:hypothetical protein
MKIKGLLNVKTLKNKNKNIMNMRKLLKYLILSFMFSFVKVYHNLLYKKKIKNPNNTEYKK